MAEKPRDEYQWQ